MNARKNLFSLIYHIAIVLTSAFLAVFIYSRFNNLPPDSGATETNQCFEFGLSLSACVTWYSLGLTLRKLFNTYTVKHAILSIMGVLFVSCMLEGLFPVLPSIGTATLVMATPWTRAGTAERICALIFWMLYLLIAFYILILAKQYFTKTVKTNSPRPNTD